MNQDLFRVDLVGRFAEVVVHCLKSTVGVEAAIAAATPCADRAPSIAVALDLTGDLRGPVTWTLASEIALELVRRLLDDPNPDPQCACDGATELANILTGHATEVLESSGFRCELGIPRLHDGLPPPGVAVRMSTASGPIDLVLSLAPPPLS